MNKLIHNKSLKENNTFGLNSVAINFFPFDKEEYLQSFIQSKAIENKKVFVLGGGSNVLLSDQIDDFIIHPCVKGIKLLEDNENFCLIEVGAGEVWEDFVEYCVQNHYYGVENLSLIPGNVGASPVQNIGAYGTEVASVIEKVYFIDLETGMLKTFNRDDCVFGYRNSIFKNKLKNKIVITRVCFRLSKQAVLNVEYGDVKSEIEKFDGRVTIENVRRAIINIRERKLPDPSVTGNAGSFFKNPVISKEQFYNLKSKYPLIPSYEQNDGTIKVPAGWLIEKTGWKGKSIGQVAVHDKQALVIINKGDATLSDVIELADRIENDVHKEFNIQLEKEVNVVGI